jgi:predicted transcriptional regulator
MVRRKVYTKEAVLAQLSKRKHRASPQAIAKKLGCHERVAQAILKELADEGVISREAHGRRLFYRLKPGAALPFETPGGNAQQPAANGKAGSNGVAHQVDPLQQLVAYRSSFRQALQGAGKLAADLERMMPMAETAAHESADQVLEALQWAEAKAHEALEHLDQAIIWTLEQQQGGAE